MSQSADQTLAVFLLDSGDAARRLLSNVEQIDKGDKNVKIVDAAIADHNKRGRVKVHQTHDIGGRKGAVSGGSIGVIAGAVLLGPVGAVVGGALGGTMAGLYAQIRDIGIDDKKMRKVAKDIGRGKSAVFVQYEGNWNASIGAVSDAIRAEHAELIDSTLPAEKAEMLRALVVPAVEDLGGQETVADYEIETSEAESPPAEEAVAAAEPPADAAAEPAADDLTRIKGVGPKTSAALVAAGIETYELVARTSEPDLRAALVAGHATVPGNVGTWSMQASFAARGDWAGLDAFIRHAAPDEAPASKAKGAKAPEKRDDLTQLAGLGPKAAEALSAAGITTYAALAAANEPAIRKALHAADIVTPSSVSTWPMQASYAEKGDWQGLTKYNQRRSGSAKATPSKSKAADTADATGGSNGADDLTQISGIGPRMETLLNDEGVTTYAALRRASDTELRTIVAKGGALPPSSLPTWPAQAAFAAKGDWNGLAAYNKSHHA